MVQIPDNLVTQQDLSEWYEVQEKLSELKSKEILLRNKIFKGIFHAPVEGTNKHDLADGWVLKATYPINRTIDVAALTNLREELDTAKVPVDGLIKYKPELVIGEYRKLTKEQLALFNAALIIKPGQAQLEIVKPKRAS